MEGTYKTNQHYRDLRDAFLLVNEGFRTTVYFDTVGIPTVAKGIALLTRKKKDENDKKPGRRFVIHNKNLIALKIVLGDNSPEYNAIENFAKQALTAIDYTEEPTFNGGKKTISTFELSDRGRQLVRLFGPLNKKWESSQSPSVSDTAARAFSSQIVDDNEKELDRLLKIVGLDPVALTEEQRIVLLSALYHGRWNTGGRDAAIAIKDGADVDKVCQHLNDPKYPSRVKNEALLLKKQWQPSKSQNIIQPSRSVQEPGISQEQASIMMEFLLPESLPQKLGCSAYEQIMLRYQGAGCDAPLKNVHATYSEIRRRYGD